MTEILLKVAIKTIILILILDFLFLTQLSISCFRVGVMLDGWMHPVDEEVYKNISQPLLMINMETFQWQENVDQMQRLQQDPNVHRPMITIK
jgi:hypothetical protein